MSTTPRTTKDIAWVGGLLEGEAAFMLKNGCPKIGLQMTDRDTMERVAIILGASVSDRSYQPKGKSTYKPVWSLSVHGVRAISWMMTLYQFLGERRQEKVRGILTAWRESKAAPRASRGTRLMATCHPDRPRKGDMLCGTCYMCAWRLKTGRDKAYYRNRLAAA